MWQLLIPPVLKYEQWFFFCVCKTILRLSHKKLRLVYGPTIMGEESLDKRVEISRQAAQMCMMKSEVAGALSTPIRCTDSPKVSIWSATDNWCPIWWIFSCWTLRHNQDCYGKVWISQIGVQVGYQIAYLITQRAKKGKWTGVFKTVIDNLFAWNGSPLRQGLTYVSLFIHYAMSRTFLNVL